MKRLLILIIILPLLYSPALADPARTRQITGVVTSIDVRNGIITVRKKDREVTINIKDRTKIRKCIKRDSIRDIKLGDRVTVRYREEDNGNRATSVTIK